MHFIELNRACFFSQRLYLNHNTTFIYLHSVLLIVLNILCGMMCIRQPFFDMFVGTSTRVKRKEKKICSVYFNENNRT